MLRAEFVLWRVACDARPEARFVGFLNGSAWEAGSDCLSLDEEVLTASKGLSAVPATSLLVLSDRSVEGFVCLAGSMPLEGEPSELETPASALGSDFVMVGEGEDLDTCSWEALPLAGSVSAEAFRTDSLAGVFSAFEVTAFARPALVGVLGVFGDRGEVGDEDRGFERDAWRAGEVLIVFVFKLGFDLSARSIPLEGEASLFLLSRVSVFEGVLDGFSRDLVPFGVFLAFFGCTGVDCAVVRLASFPVCDCGFPSGDISNAEPFNISPRLPFGRSISARIGCGRSRSFDGPAR